MEIMVSVDADAYIGVRDRIISLVRTADSSVIVPTCPRWRVKDVVGHLAGLCEDWVSRRLDGYASHAWTAAQVDRFRACTVDEVFERWYSASERFVLLDDDPMMGPPARWAFGDGITHEADIRGALGAGHVPDEAMLVGLRGSISRWREVLSLAGAKCPAVSPHRDVAELDPEQVLRVRVNGPAGTCRREGPVAAVQASQQYGQLRPQPGEKWPGVHAHESHSQ